MGKEQVLPREAVLDSFLEPHKLSRERLEWLSHYWFWTAYFPKERRQREELEHLQQEVNNVRTRGGGTLNIPARYEQAIFTVLAPIMVMDGFSFFNRGVYPSEKFSVSDYIKEAAQNLFDALRPLKMGDTGGWKTETDWQVANHRTHEICESLPRERDAKLDPNFEFLLPEVVDLVARFAASKIEQGQGIHIGSRSVSWGSVRAVAHNALLWETIKDMSGFEKNPYLAKLNLLAAGAVRIGFYQVEEQAGQPKEALVVDFPLYHEEEVVLGCLAFLDGGPYDEKALYAHGLTAKCSKVKPLSSSTPPRIIVPIRY